MSCFLTLLYAFLLAGLTAGKNGCRQCTGHKILTFKLFVSQDVATEFLGHTFDGCNTGGQWLISDTIPGGDNPATCSSEGTFACREWKFKLQIWRYCGNGGGVQHTKGKFCIGPLCSLTDTLILTCTKSVECGTKCDCNKCGC